MLLQGLGCAAGVQGIVAKAINVFGLVRTERGQGFRVRGVAFVQQLPQPFHLSSAVGYPSHES
jgi:hypothetical protein